MAFSFLTTGYQLSNDHDILSGLFPLFVNSSPQGILGRIESMIVPQKMGGFYQK
jgi:hypothetical protein